MFNAFGYFLAPMLSGWLMNILKNDLPSCQHFRKPGEDCPCAPRRPRAAAPVLLQLQA